MYVIPAHRGTGLGKRLLEAVETRARDRGYEDRWFEKRLA
jgi:GNAT superfamily N-acetyltransferase